MALPTLRDVRPVNPVLTDMSIGLKNAKFFWDQIAPVKPTDQQSGTYFIYTRDYWMRRWENALRAPEGASTRINYGVSTDTYNALERSFEKPLGRVTLNASQTPENLQTQDVAFLTNAIQLELEKLAAAAFFVTGVWGTSTTLAGGDQWSDFANSDPIANVDTAMNTIRRGTGNKPNSMFIGVTAWQKLREHPLILDKYKHTQAGIMTPQLVAAALELDEVIVGESAENTGAPGGTYAGADIWTDNVLFLVKANPALGTPNGGTSFVWNEANNVPWAVEEYDEPQTKSHVTGVFTHVDMEVTSAQSGYIYLDAVA
jgi:hypothetical protein